MRSDLNPPLTAKNGRILQVILACRVSSPGPGKQDIRSLSDQESLYREWLSDHTDLPMKVMVIAGSGSGETLDRKEFLELANQVETGQYDLVLCEDLGRIVRRMHAHLFAETCVDFETRLISINDNVDTAHSGWQDRTIFSAWHHERSNRDTSDRIKRTHRSRFSQGGVLPHLIPGYIKTPGAKSDAEVRKDPDWEPIYDEWFARLERGDTFSDVADWLNAKGVPTGCKRGNKRTKDKYDCALVGQRTRNAILKGQRERNNRESRRVNSTGRRRTVKAPPELKLERDCPHLAFIAPERYDRVIALLSERNGKYARGRKSGADSRKNVSRKRTVFPGQCIYCGMCGRLFVFGGHGQNDHLMCQGARDHLCWNGVSVDGPLAAAKISEAVFGALRTLKDFDSTFSEILNEEVLRANEALDGNAISISIDLEKCERELANLLHFLRDGNHSEVVREELRRIEEERSRLLLAKATAERSRVNEIVLPTANMLRQLADDTFRDLALDSYEFANSLRRLVPRIVVFPYRLCDGGKIVLRARFRLKLAALLAEHQTHPVLEQEMDRVLEVDLFNPPQREAYRNQVVALKSSGMMGSDIASALGITTTAVNYALALQRRMDKLGLTEAYQAVLEPPEDCIKLCRHKHPRYKFEPLDDAGVI